ncbi:MAG TPA: hypothetical protein VNS32_11370, partial [Flavisolibacter sp.]|nr:hypothetical protein [Flavisolibacter sp.]
WHDTNDTFHSISVKITDTTFALVQSNRVPVPAWVGSGHYSADTLWMQPVISGRQLLNNFQGKVGTYSEKKDTLTLKYMYEGPIVSTSYGDDGSVYIVSQKWVRQ